MTFNPRGFVPYRSTGACLGGTTRTYATRAKNVKQIFVGDLVVAVSGATGNGITPYVVATDGTAAAAGILGVVESIYDSNRKPLVFSQPNKGPYLETATAGYVDVNIDPNQTYLAVVNGTASAQMAGRYLAVDTTVAGTVTGISPMGVGVAATANAFISTTITEVPFDAQWPLFCLGVEAFEDEVDHDPLSNSYKGAHGGKVEVKINNNLLGGYANQALRLVS